MEIDEHKDEGLKSYYITKIEELQLIVSEKKTNLPKKLTCCKFFKVVKNKPSSECFDA